MHLRIVTATFALATLLQPSRRLGAGDAPMGRSQELFKRVFGSAVVSFDPVAVRRLKGLPDGERLKLDTDGDGLVDTIYFIDTDPKHDSQLRPILVKVVDQDGDMDRDGDGDLDSDLYIADYHADGSVDAVVEYKDTDHDNGVDEMGIYTYSWNKSFLGTDALQVWWSHDLARTHQLWETVNYRYQQTECQFHSAFGGDEVFSSYIFDDKRGTWVPAGRIRSDSTIWMGMASPRPRYASLVQVVEPRVCVTALMPITILLGTMYTTTTFPSRAMPPMIPRGTRRSRYRQI